MVKNIAKGIYNALPFKKHFFSLLKHLKPSPSLYQHLHFKDWIWVPVGTSGFKIYHYGFQVENDLFWSGINGNWESQSLDLWIKLCKQSETILDIGANTGVYALVAGAVNNKATIFAFEPGRQVGAKLKKNVQANPFPIKVIDTAISDSAGIATFYDTNTHNYTASLNSSHGANTVEYQVKTQSLDSFIEENRLKVDLLKIDVERHEPQVMEGFQKYVRLQQPSILMEILDEEVGRAVQQLIAGVPYLYFSLHESGTIRRVDQLTKSDDFNYLICRAEVAESIGLI